MSRGYPKFLFSNPQHTEDKGPFIVHLMWPKKLYVVKWQFLDSDADIDEIKSWGDECSNEESAKVYRRMIAWFNSQLKTKAIKYPLTKEEREHMLKNSLPPEARKNLKFYRPNSGSKPTKK